jgi:hypothetical protein
VTINVRITGGLGNQLFKFFHGVSLSDVYQDRLVLDRTWYVDPRDRRNLVSSRQYDLDFFPEISSMHRIEWVSPRAHRLFGQVLRRAPLAIQLEAGYMTDLNRSMFSASLRKPRFIDGSFENLEFLPNKDKVLNFLQIEIKGEWLSEQLNQVALQNPLAIHVRRGDFLNLPRMYDVVSREYYLAAISASEKAVGVKPIHLFSDDPKKAIDFLGDGVKIDRVIRQEQGIKTSEIFYLLSRYHSIISANSTFSWWAGYVAYLRGELEFCSMPERFLGHGYTDPAQKLRHSGVTVITG